MEIEYFFEPDTSTLTYIVFDPNQRDAVIIDPVSDYNPHSSRISHRSADAVADFVKDNGLKIQYLLETHAHADHISASRYLKTKFPNALYGIAETITQVQTVFKELFNASWMKADGSQFDRLLKDNETIKAGSLSIKVMFTPGHTPACTSFQIKDAVFTGDALFMPDVGTGRCDFPKGDAGDLYDSITQRIYTLPDQTRVFAGHDYPKGRAVRCYTTVAESKRANVRLNGTMTREEFVTNRQRRDKELDAPHLLLPSIQINANGGIYPPAESNGVSYLKIPIRE